MNDVQSRLLSSLGLILHEVPAAKRPGLSEQIDGLLKLGGLDLEDHRYLLGERFKHLLPGAQKPPALERRTIVFSLAVGSWPDYSWEDPFVHGLTSRQELATAIRRTVRMIDVYQKDKRYRDGDGNTCLNLPRSRQTLLLRYQSGFHPSDSELTSMPTLTQALAQAPALGYQGMKPRSVY